MAKKNPNDKNLNNYKIEALEPRLMMDVQSVFPLPVAVPGISVPGAFFFGSAAGVLQKPLRLGHANSHKCDWRGARLSGVLGGSATQARG